MDSKRPTPGPSADEPKQKRVTTPNDEKAPASTPKQIFNWPPLESNPEIFTAYLSSLGLPPTHTFGELYGLDEDCLGFVQGEVLSVIINAERLKPPSEQDFGVEGGGDVDFYMKQPRVLDNACGIIACLHSVFNIPDLVASLDKTLTLHKFLSDVIADKKNADQIAESLNVDDSFKSAHTIFATEGQSDLSAIVNQKQVKHHYSAFVLNKSGQLVEMDGTKRGPIVLGEEKCEDLLRGAVKEIQRRLEAGMISETLSVMTLNKTFEG